MFRINSHPLLPIDESLPRSGRGRPAALQRRHTSNESEFSKPTGNARMAAGSDLFYLFIGISVWALDAVFWCVCVYWWVK